HLRLSRAHRTLAAAAPQKAGASLPQGEAALRRAQALRPAEPVVWLETAAFYETAGYLGRPDVAALDAAYARALSLSPNQAFIYLAWGETLARRGARAQADALRQTAVRLDATLARDAPWAASSEAFEWGGSAAALPGVIYHSPIWR
ncbi:MAG: hypothetical protein ACK2UK_00155, partial [Candidatus Promineifilaceae bacterium]